MNDILNNPKTSVFLRSKGISASLSADTLKRAYNVLGDSFIFELYDFLNTDSYGDDLKTAVEKAENERKRRLETEKNSADKKNNFRTNFQKWIGIAEDVTSVAKAIDTNILGAKELQEQRQKEEEISIKEDNEAGTKYFVFGIIAIIVLIIIFIAIKMLKKY